MLEKEGYGHMKHHINVYKRGKGLQYSHNNRMYKGMG